MQHFLQLMVVGVSDKPRPILLGLAHIISISPASREPEKSEPCAIIEMANGDMYESTESFEFIVKCVGGVPADGS